jgi:hypothetical protein
MAGIEQRRATKIALRAIWHEEDDSDDSETVDCVQHISDVRDEIISDYEEINEVLDEDDEAVPRMKDSSTS